MRIVIQKSVTIHRIVLSLAEGFVYHTVVITEEVVLLWTVVGLVGVPAQVVNKPEPVPTHPHLVVVMIVLDPILRVVVIEMGVGLVGVLVQTVVDQEVVQILLLLVMVMGVPDLVLSIVAIEMGVGVPGQTVTVAEIRLEHVQIRLQHVMGLIVLESPLEPVEF